MKNSRRYFILETIFLFTKIFGEKSSHFNTHWECLNLTKKDTDAYITFASIVNRECEEFKLHKLTLDMFKCLIFVQGLTAPKDAKFKSIKTGARFETDTTKYHWRMSTNNKFMPWHCKILRKEIFCTYTLSKKRSIVKVFLLKSILVMDADKYTYIKIAHLKIKSIIIVEIRDKFSYCRKEPRKKRIQNL